MADVKELQSSFVRGMRQDEPRDQMIPGSAWNLLDLLVGVGAPLRKRGGWSDGSPDLSGIAGTPSYVQALSWIDFIAGGKLLVIDEDGRAFSVTADASGTDLGASGHTAIKQEPVQHDDKAIIVSEGQAPRYWDGGAQTTGLSGSPPSATYATVYKDYTVMGRTSANPNRIFFSEPGNPNTTWDVTNSNIDVSQPISGLAALKSALLIFSNGQVERIRGVSPPPDSDMILEPLFEVGCLDARSICGYGDNIVFANALGVFITDGTSLADITYEGGMSRYWRELLSGWSSTWRIAAGVFQNSLVVSVMDGTTFKDAFICDVPRRVWVRVSNLDAVMFSRRTQGAEELYMGRRDTDRVARLSTIWTPSSSVKNDADGTAVVCTFESPFYQDEWKMRGWQHAYVTYYLADAASDNPVLALSAARSVSGSYTQLGSNLAENTAEDRVRRKLGFSKRGMALKLVQTNASADTRLHSIAVGATEREPSS